MSQPFLEILPVPKHILSIDDEAPILDLIQRFLTAKGFRVTTAQTAAEARKVVETDPPDLIITDLQLEDSDGLKLVEELHNRLPTAPVILLTGVLFDAKAVEENIGKRVSAYVDKTSSLKKLVSEVNRLLGD